MLFCRNAVKILIARMEIAQWMGPVAVTLATKVTGVQLYLMNAVVVAMVSAMSRP